MRSILTRPTPPAPRFSFSLTEARARLRRSWTRLISERLPVELDRVGIQTAEQLADCRTSAEQAQIAVRTARTELEEVRAREGGRRRAGSADAAIQQAIADRGRVLR
ncbi:MAG: hypothetical protein ACRDU4_01060 [Mycobacterium sp.]